MFVYQCVSGDRAILSFVFIWIAFFVVQYNPKESRVLGVFGLSLYTGEKDLKEMFGKYGPLEEVQVVYDHQVCVCVY